MRNTIEREEALLHASKESVLSFDLEEEGVCIKADTVGGLEALAMELKEIDVPIRAASIGSRRRDIRGAETSANPLHRLILGFSTAVLSTRRARLTPRRVV